MWNTSKILEALATIKADTANHKEDLQEFKDAFGKHIEKENREAIETSKKMDAIKGNLQSLECPFEEKILKLERRFYDTQKVHESRRATDREDRAKESAIEAKARSEKDEEIAKEISSLKTARKYQWLTASGIYIILGVILKKIFTP